MATTTWSEYAEEAEKASGGFGKHPMGLFNMRVDTADTKPAQNDKRAILARMVTIDGPAEGKSLLNNMTPFKNNGEPNGYFMQELSALGFGRENNPQFWVALDAMTHEQGMTYIAQAIIGATAIVTVNERKYQQEMRDNVKSMDPIGSKVVTAVLEPEIVQPTLPGAAAIPGVASPITVNVAGPPIVAPTPAVLAPVAAGPGAAPVPVAAAPVAVPPVAAAPAPVAQPVVVESVVAVPAEPVADVPAPVVTPVAAAVPAIQRPPGAPF